MRNKSYTYDNNLLLKDAGLVAASGAATVNSTAKVLDLGGSSANADQGGGTAQLAGAASPGFFEGDIVIDTSACEADTGNELYTIVAEVSNASDFSSGVFGVGAVRLGHSSTTLESATTAVPSRRYLRINNEIDGVTYRYLRLYTVVAGTIATGINYKAFVGVPS